MLVGLTVDTETVSVVSTVNTPVLISRSKASTRGRVESAVSVVTFSAFVVWTATIVFPAWSVTAECLTDKYVEVAPVQSNGSLLSMFSMNAVGMTRIIVGSTEDTDPVNVTELAALPLAP